MTKTTAFFGTIAAVVLILWMSYNNIVTKNVAVSTAWSEVGNQLTRRSGLIPNLVETVKGYAAHEEAIFTEVAAARAQIATAVKLDVSQLANDPALQKQLLDANQQLGASLGRLIAVAEAYPDLKASENFSRLQDELAGTENRVTVARNRAIEATGAYNRVIVTFPGVLLAKHFGFGPKDFYVAPEEKTGVPTVEFN